MKGWRDTEKEKRAAWKRAQESIAGNIAESMYPRHNRKPTVKRGSWYVYVLIDPRDGIPFYIGKGCDARMYRHELAVRNGDTLHNSLLHNKLQEIIDAGLGAIHCMDSSHKFESDAYDREALIIKELRESEIQLTNIIGNGFHTRNSRKKMGDTLRATWAAQRKRDGLPSTPAREGRAQLEYYHRNKDLINAKKRERLVAAPDKAP